VQALQKRVRDRKCSSAVTNSVRFEPHSVSAKVDNQASFGCALSPLTDKRVMQIALRLEF
jgi:hypothetical protein